MPKTPSIKQSSFAGGEVAPQIYGRTDLPLYRQSLQTCLNWLISATGALKNRPGTKLVREARGSIAGEMQFNPDDDISGLEMWFDPETVAADSGYGASGYDQNDLVSWVDRTGVYTASPEADPGESPQIAEGDTPGGKDSVWCDHVTNEWMSIAPAFTSSGATAAFTVFVVATWNRKSQAYSVGTNQEGGGATDDHLELYHRGSNSVAELAKQPVTWYLTDAGFADYGNSSDIAFKNPTVDPPADGSNDMLYYVHTVVCKVEGTGRRMSVLRGNADSLLNTSGDTLTPSDTGFTFDSMSENGRWSELLVYNRELTIEEITQVENYLANKHGLSGGSLDPDDPSLMVSGRVRLIPWVFNQDQAYALEFGKEYIRFHTQGGTVVESVASGEHDGGDDSATLTDSGESWTADEWVGSIYNINDGSSGFITSNTDNDVTAVLTGGTENRWDDGDKFRIEMPFEVPTPYSLAEVRKLNYAQSGDLMVLTVNTKKAHVLRRFGDTSWTFASYNPLLRHNLVEPPINLRFDFFIDPAPFTGTHSTPNDSDDLVDTGNPFTADALPDEYAQNTTKSFTAQITSNTVSTVVHGNAVVGTTGDWDIGDGYTIQQVGWSTSDATHPEEDWTWYVTAVDAAGKESLTGTTLRHRRSVLYIDKQKPKIVWAAATTAPAPSYYRIYRGRTSTNIYGLVGETEQATFIDDAGAPDYTLNPPEFARGNIDPHIFESAVSSGDLQTVEGTSTEVLKGAGTSLAVDRVYTYVVEVTMAANTHADILQPFCRESTGGGFLAIDLIQVSNYTDEQQTYLEQFDVYIPGLSADMSGLTATFGCQEFGAGPGILSVVLKRVTWRGEPTTVPGADLLYGFPAAVAFYEQRLAFGGFSVAPQRLRLSASGRIFDFLKPPFTVASSPIDLDIASRSLDEIRDIVPLSFLVISTASGIWVAQGPEGTPLTPTSFDIKPRVQYGASTVPLLPVGDAILFVTERGAGVREVVTGALSGPDPATRDLMVLAPHLLSDAGYKIEEWQYAQHPDQVVWAVRSDGSMLGLTYVRDQNLWGWHRHSTGTADSFESVCVIPEGESSQVYVSVKRTVNGVMKRFIERFAPRRVDDENDWIFMDSALTYDGRNLDGVTTLTITEIASNGYDALTSITLTSSDDVLNAAHIGDQFELTGSDGLTVRVQVTAWTSDTEVTATTQADVPASLQSTATSTWGRAVNSVAGLDHLEGEAVAILVDGACDTQKTVSSGAITLTTGIFGVRINVGLPYNSDMVTMPLDVEGDEGTARRSQKSIQGVALELNNWNGLYVGAALDDLTEVQQRAVQDSFSIISDESKIVVVHPSTSYSMSIAVAARQQDPLPVTIASLITGIKIGGNQ